jgi:hypothetical protein
LLRQWVAENRVGNRFGGVRSDELQPVQLGAHHPGHQIRLTLDDGLTRDQAESQYLVGTVGDERGEPAPDG